MLALRDGHWRVSRHPWVESGEDGIVGGKDAAEDACHLDTSFNLTTELFKELIYLLPRYLDTCNLRSQRRLVYACRNRILDP